MATYGMARGEHQTIGDEPALDLYNVLGPVSGTTKIYVDRQDGTALKVTGVRRDEDGDLILETFPAQEQPKFRKIG